MVKNYVFIGFLLLLTTGISSGQHSGKELPEELGMVSYTYRHSFEKDIEKTLDTIQSLGIKNMEFSNLFGADAKELRKMLDERNMVCTSFGVGYDALINNTEEVARNAKILGAEFVRVASIPHGEAFTFENAEKAVEDFNTAGKILKEKYDLTFCYHNHGYEFQPYNNGTFFDYIVENTDPDYVSFEMDVLWVFHPGHDPVELLKKYGNRFKLMHVKDLKKGIKGDYSGSTPVENDVALGTGQLDLPAIIKAAKAAGVKYYYIEDESPNVAVQVPKSIAYLRSLLEQNPKK
jgi:sugar phosphate isomerase/epimerase